MIEQASDHQIAYLRLLADRLERLSADSIWARRASGLRRSLIKALEHVDKKGTLNYDSAIFLTSACLEMLKKAAFEIPDPDHFST
ncbi:MAG TPA: hypothetical protein VN226_03545 [Anaerolineales bacterium]|nr:hypothetical protein [Anaerolineales bacterium]